MFLFVRGRQLVRHEHARGRLVCSCEGSHGLWSGRPSPLRGVYLPRRAPSPSTGKPYNTHSMCFRGTGPQGSTSLGAGATRSREVHETHVAEMGGFTNFAEIWY